MRSHTTMFIAAMIALLASCGSVPTPALPDGRTRAPVNDQEKIDEYTARAARAAASTSDGGSALRQIDELKRDLASLKLYLASIAAEQPSAPTGTGRDSAVRNRVSYTKAPPQEYLGSRESVEVREQSLVFRVAHGAAESEFAPSAELQRALLAAAREAGLIEIRGRSDASVATASSRRISLARAQKARQYLIKNGIAARKIRISYLAAGGFAADNTTPAGKAKNRRVEVETMDLQTASFAASGYLRQGGTP